MTEQTNGMVAAFLRLMRDREKRPLVIRYLAPTVTALLALLFAALPMIVFRSVGGDSDVHSLFYWQHVNFFGEGTRWGSLQFLQNATSGNQYLGLYRAVTTLYVVSVFFFLVGAALSVLLSLSAIYLLMTEEKTEKGKRIGRIFRVIAFHRGALLIPSAMLLIPFLYHHLLAYLYTTYQSFQSTARFRPIDPLILMLLLFTAQVFLMLWAKNKEKGLDYVIFCSFDAVKEERKKRLEEERAWEDEVRIDASREPSVLRTAKADDPHAPEEETDSSVEEKADLQKEKPVDEESLFGVSYVLSDEETPKTAEHPSEEEGETEASRKETDAEEMRRSIRSLFADDDNSKK